MEKVINKDLKIVCEGFSNSRNWGHIAYAFYKGMRVEGVKVIYQNRTWERYQYETVMNKLVHTMDITKVVPLKDRIQAYKLINA